MKNITAITLCFLAFASCNHKPETADDSTPQRSLRLGERPIGYRLDAEIC